MSSSGIAAYFQSQKPQVCTKMKNLTKSHLNLQWPLQGIFQLGKIAFLRTGSKSSPVKQTEWDTYFHWYTPTSKTLRFQNGFMEIFVKKANEKLKTQETPNIKTIGPV